MYVDSHCHLHLLDLSKDQGDTLDSVIQRARDAGVTNFLCVCTELSEYATLVEISEQHQDIHISVGVHPNHQPGESMKVGELIELSQHPKIIAIGETGLDYFRVEGDLNWQRDRFAHHIDVAKQVRKPLIIHTRQAQNDTIDIMRQERAQDIGGVMHCFTEDWDMATKALDLNFYISFSGIVTFKNAKTLHDVATRMPLEKMLIETDCPYLAPVPHRGKQNEPSYVSFVAEFIAQLRGESVETIAKTTSENYFTLFNPL